MWLTDEECQCHTDDKSANQINNQGARWKLGKSALRRMDRIQRITQPIEPPITTANNDLYIPPRKNQGAIRPSFKGITFDDGPVFIHFIQYGDSRQDVQLGNLVFIYLLNNMVSARSALT